MNPMLAGPSGPGAVYDRDSGQWALRGLSMIGTNVQIDDYTLAVDDAGNVIEMDVAVGNEILIPQGLDVPVGSLFEVCQVDEGQTTVVADTGVTLRIPVGASPRLHGQWSSATLRKRAADEYVLSGDLEPS